MAAAKSASASVVAEPSVVARTIHPQLLSSASLSSSEEEHNVEAQALFLLGQLQSGAISVADLMGPLFGPNTSSLTPEIAVTPGDRTYLPVAPPAEFLPRDDAANILLEEHVHPPGYINPIPNCDDSRAPYYDLVVIGAGVSGLISVIIGAWLGKKCALIERHSMGGDCLNSGCVPSKALIACARAANSVKSLHTFGVNVGNPIAVTIDFPFIMQRMRAIRAQISHHDSVARYSREFCKHVFVGHAQFVGDHHVEVKGDDGSIRVLRFKKAMVATGASPSIPRVLRPVAINDNDGNTVAQSAIIPHLTNSNFFNLQELPPRMIVIGCGAVGLELAQCMARFGCQVVCVDAAKRLLPREDPDAGTQVHAQMVEDGK
jgi:thioredoxin reductase